MAQEIEITVRKAETDDQCRREQRYAAGVNGGAVDIALHREWRRGRHVYDVRWNANRGRGWFKGYGRMNMTEEAARALFEERWAYLTAWLEKLEPVTGGGAVDAFSAQVASMR